MPNWVFNRLAITGARSDLDAFVDRVRSRSSADDATVLDFETIVPIPDELRDSQDLDPDDPHGFPKWRTWAVDHWGTKWNAWYADVDRDPETGPITYSFQTAWTPPDKWLAAASGAFPSLEFVHEYVEEMAQFAGRGRWQAGAVVDHQELDPDEIEWVGDDEDDDEEQSLEPPVPPAEIGEPIDEDALRWAAWLVESVIELGMNAQRRRRWSSESQTWMAAVTEHVGEAARCARLISAADEAYAYTPEQARDAAGNDLLRRFSEQLVLAGAEAIHAAAWFRLQHEGGSDREAREKEMAEAVEVAAESDDLTSTGRAPSDWLLWIVRYLGEAADALTAAERVRRGHETPEWVDAEHDSAADAARYAFGLLATACIEAVAIFAPEDLKPEEIKQPSFWDEIHKGRQERQP